MHPGYEGPPTYEDVPPPEQTVWYDEPHTRPAASLRLTEPPMPAKRRPPWLAICTLVVAFACLGMTSAIAVAWISDRGTISRQEAQIKQLRHDMPNPATAAKTARTAAQANARLSGRVAGIETRLAPLAAYGPNVCSLPVTGSHGPVQAYFRCSYSPNGG